MADMDGVPFNQWQAAPDGLLRCVTIPEQVQVVSRPDGSIVLLLVRNGEDLHRLVLSQDQARHLSRLLNPPVKTVERY